MKRYLLTLSAAAVALLSIGASRHSAGNDDPTVMTVNGKDVKQSEFLYLYNKNNSQQAQPQSIDEYVDLFVVYKLKVAAAEAAGLDTAATFRSELEGYCADLAAPYLIDKAEEKRLLDDAFRHTRTRRRVSHILLPAGATYAEDREVCRRLDSIRSAIVAGADFAQMASKYSADGSAVRNGGDIGYIRVGQLPYKFEEAVYDTPVGELSQVVEDLPYGFHILKVTDERPEKGEVSARHILKLTQGLSPEEAAVRKAEIDSIAGLLRAGADFEALARRESDDPGSAARGGNLGFFGRGVMVPEFEQTAYSLSPGQISEPFRTSYGWHIVQTLEYKPLPDFDDLKETLVSDMARDGRSKLPRRAYLASLRQRTGSSVDSVAVDRTLENLRGIADSREALARLAGDVTAVANVDGTVITVSDVARKIDPYVPADNMSMAFRYTLDGLLDEAAIVSARRHLAEDNEEYRNLVNEYRDGMLLFEAANRNVWARAAEDDDAQKRFFAENKDKYTWDRPRFKGCVVFATNDSIAAEARKYLAEKGAGIAADTLARTVFNHFAGEVKLERVLVAKGDNPIIDEIAFGGAKAKPVGRWTIWFAWNDRVIDTPEEAADVRAAVIGDLQQQFEARWVDDLRKLYPVKLNKKTIKKLK